MKGDSRGSAPTRRTIGCFPLYPPLELIHSMGFSPVVLWGFPASGLAEADRHVQPYVCSVGRRLAQYVLAGAAGSLAGIFHYNACDTLRNLPEILQSGAGGAEKLPAVSMHLPAVETTRPSWEKALGASIKKVIDDIEKTFGATFDEGRFAESVELYTRLRGLLGHAAVLAREGGFPFGEYARLSLDASLRAPEEAVAALEAALARPRGESPPTGGTPVIVSGILPPPGNGLARMEELGLRIVGDDIAAMSRARSLAPSAAPGTGPVEYYRAFYRGHAPCPTLLYTADVRPAHLARLAEETGAAGAVFIGEKFCEYEYFEFPFVRKELAKRGVPSLVLEFAADDAGLSASHVTRIQAFAELLRGGKG